MDQEFITLETAQKLADYKKLLLQKRNLVQFLKNQVVINKNNREKFKKLQNKEQYIIACANLSMAQELLELIY